MGVLLATESGYSNGKNMGNPVNDCYGYLTQTAGTEIVRVVPPHSEARSCLGNFAYMSAGTAHLLTVMVAMDETIVTSDVAAGATVIPVGKMPDGFDGGQLTANDYIIVQYEDGTWGAIKVTSVANLNITVPATSQKILANSKLFMMGVAADHPNRQFQTIASTMYQFIASDFRVRGATSSKKGSPLLFYSPNNVAAGTLHYLNYYFD